MLDYICGVVHTQDFANDEIWVRLLVGVFLAGHFIASQLRLRSTIVFLAK